MTPPTPPSLRVRFAALPDNVRGALWLLLSSVLFSVMALAAKVAGNDWYRDGALLAPALLREPLSNSSSPLRPSAEAAIAAAAARRVAQPRLVALASGATKRMRPQVRALRGFQPAPAAALRPLDVTRHAFENAPCRGRRLKARGPDELLRGSPASR